MGEKPDTDIIKTYTVRKGQMVILLSSYSVNLFSIRIFRICLSKSSD